MASSIYTEIRKRIEALKIGAVLLCNLFNFADYDVSAFINIASLTVKYHRCNSVNKTILSRCRKNNTTVYNTIFSHFFDQNQQFGVNYLLYAMP